jgi:hypothetical protein
MTVLIPALLGIELLAYFVLLGRLSSVMKARKPDLFAAVGGPAPWDYMMLGFGPGDTFISKLESRRDEVADEPSILMLMKAIRAIYMALLLTGCAWLFVVVSHAN